MSTTSTGRRAVVVLLSVVAVAATLLSAVAWWTDELIGDTDRYVATVGPLVDDPAFNDALADQLTDLVVQQLDLSGVATEGAASLAENRELGPRSEDLLLMMGSAIAGWAEDRVATTVDAVVASPEFAEAWREANREAHAQTVALLSGEDGEFVEVDSDSVGVNVAALVEAVKARLLDRGFALAERIPPVDARFILLQTDDLGTAQRAFSTLHGVRNVLPVVAVLAAGGAVFWARRRAVTARRLAIGLIATLAIVAAALAWAGSHYPGQWGFLPTDAARAVFDALAAPLWSRLALWTSVGLLGLTAAVLAAGRPSARSELAPAVAAALAGSAVVVAGWGWLPWLGVVLAAAVVAAVTDRLRTQ